MMAIVGSNFAEVIAEQPIHVPEMGQYLSFPELPVRVHILLYIVAGRTVFHDE